MCATKNYCLNFVFDKSCKVFFKYWFCKIQSVVLNQKHKQRSFLLEYFDIWREFLELFQIRVRIDSCGSCQNSNFFDIAILNHNLDCRNNYAKDSAVRIILRQKSFLDFPKCPCGNGIARHDYELAIIFKKILNSLFCKFVN